MLSARDILILLNVDNIRYTYYGIYILQIINISTKITISILWGKK